MNKEEALKQLSDEINKLKFYFDTLTVIEKADPGCEMRVDCLRAIQRTASEVRDLTDAYEKIQ